MGDANRELSTSDLAERPETNASEEAATEEETGRGDDATASADEERERGPLLPQNEGEDFTKRWRDIQTGFVDEPRESVAKADALVAELMQRLAAGFSEERHGLEAQWDSGDNVSTEDLRVALTRYRSFFDRLLSA